jgi:hypothetical protein
MEIAQSGLSGKFTKAALFSATQEAALSSAILR